MTVEKDERIIVGVEIRVAQEIFRASRTTWVRYLRPDGSNGYATEYEWIQWRNGVE